MCQISFSCSDYFIVRPQIFIKTPPPLSLFLSLCMCARTKKPPNTTPKYLHTCMHTMYECMWFCVLKQKKTIKINTMYCYYYEILSVPLTGLELINFNFCTIFLLFQKSCFCVLNMNLISTLQTTNIIPVELLVIPLWLNNWSPPSVIFFLLDMPQMLH